MKQLLNYACIGAGGIANKKHLSNYSSMEDVKIEAICDIDKDSAELLAKKYKIPRVYSDYREMFRKEQLDLVSICTPNFTHKQIAVDALNAGIHVHCEKPAALNAKEVEEIISAQKKSGKKVLIGVNNRFTDQSALIKRIIQEGYIGEIYRAKCGWERNSGIPGIGKWFTVKEKSGGGALIDLGVHMIDLALYMMDFPEIEDVCGSTYKNFYKSKSRIRPGYSRLPNGVFDVEDGASGYVTFCNGSSMNLDFSWASNIEKETKYLELLGTKGGVTLIDDQVKICTQIGDTCFSLTPDEKTIPKSSNEMTRFVDCILHDRPCPVSLEQALEVAQIIDKIYLSAEKKQ